MAESEEELKGFLMKVKEESEKVGLKFNIQENLWSPSAVLLMIGCPLEPPGSFKKKKKIQHSENEDNGIWSHHFTAKRSRNNGNSDRLFWGAEKSLQVVTAGMKLKDACSLAGKL